MPPSGVFCVDNSAEGRRAGVIREQRGPGGTLPVSGFTYITGDGCRAHSTRSLDKNGLRNGFPLCHREVVYQH